MDVLDQTVMASLKPWKNVKIVRVKVEVDEVVDPPYRRSTLGEKYELDMLRESLEMGQVLPLIVMKNRDGRYQLVDGWRRLNLLRQMKKEQGLKRLEVDAYLLEGLMAETGEVEDVAEEAALIYSALINQTHKEFDMNDMLSIVKRLMEMGYKKVEIARILNRSKSWMSVISKYIDLVEEEGQVKPSPWSGWRQQQSQRMLDEKAGQQVGILERTETGAAVGGGEGVSSAESEGSAAGQDEIERIFRSVEEAEGGGEAVEVEEEGRKSDRLVNYALSVYVDKDVRKALDLIRRKLGAYSDSEAARLAILKYAETLGDGGEDEN